MNKDKLRFAVAKEIDKGNKIISQNDFGTTEEQFDEAVRFLSRENYLKGFTYGDNRPIFIDGAAYLTEDGENYLKENNRWSKTYKGSKEIRDWLKF